MELRESKSVVDIRTLAANNLDTYYYITNVFDNLFFSILQVMCLLCHKIMTQRKLDTIKRHTIRRHAELLSMTDEERQRLYQQLNAAQSTQRFLASEATRNVEEMSPSTATAQVGSMQRRPQRNSFEVFRQHVTLPPALRTIPRSRKPSRSNLVSAKAFERLMRHGKCFPGFNFSNVSVFRTI